MQEHKSWAGSILALQITNDDQILWTLSSAGSERCPYKAEVAGSIPAASTTLLQAFAHRVRRKESRWLSVLCEVSRSRIPPMSGIQRAEPTFCVGIRSQQRPRKAKSCLTYPPFHPSEPDKADYMHHVYILYSDPLGKYYIGSTADVERRTAQHNNLPEGFTKSGRPWRLVYVEDFGSKTDALKREKYLKRMKSRRFIEELIQKKS